MLLRFTKMHGLGNDFVMLDLVTQHFKLRPRHIRKIADRHLGVGCDQVLVVEPPRSPDVDFRYRIYNADGNEVEQCGNGARCFARFVREKRLTNKRRILVETSNGIIELVVRDNHQVEVDMGVPVLEPDAIPFTSDQQAVHYPLQVDGQMLQVGALSMGNPHAVLRVEDVDTCELETLGPLIEAHSDFPQKVNAGFMQVESRSEVRLRVFERGVGETRACGTGACAAAAHGMLAGWLDDVVTVHLPGGKLTIKWPGPGEHLTMLGPTASVFEGTVKI